MFETIVNADIFFFITALAVILITLVVLALLIVIINIFANVMHITKRVRRESDALIDDVQAIHAAVRRQSSRVSGFISVFLPDLAHKKKKSSKKKKSVKKKL